MKPKPKHTPMKAKPFFTPSRHRRGFTLVEIMIVVSLIALLSSLAVPAVQRARKRAQATRVLNDLRALGDSLDRWALENNRAGTATATFEDVRLYLKQGSQLYESGRDVLGNVIGPEFVVDEGPKVPDATWVALSDVAPAEFWSPYR